MKKNYYNFLIGILCTLVLITSSCDKNCDDCGPSSYTFYYMLNSTSDPVVMTWFGALTTRPSNVAHVVAISAGEQILLYESSSYGVGAKGEIILSPIEKDYDSVRVASVSDTITYFRGDCGKAGNPLCEESYELIKLVDNKDGKAEEWLFEIK